jgi:hypothetical protein
LTGAHTRTRRHEGGSRRARPAPAHAAAAATATEHWKRSSAVGAPKPNEERAALLRRTMDVEAVQRGREA